MQHPGEDDLALLALGETVAGTAAHVQDCSRCDGEVRALRATVATARRSDMLELEPPPPAVWQRIADELGIPDAEKRAPVVGHANSGKPGTRTTRFGKAKAARAEKRARGSGRR